MSIIRLKGNYPAWIMAIAGVLNLIYFLLLVAAIAVPVLNGFEVISVSWLLAFVPAFALVGFVVLMMIFGTVLAVKLVSHANRF